MYIPSSKTSCATVAKFKRSDEYDSNIHALLRFLSRTGESGYTFAIAQHEGLIPAINSELLEMSRKRGKKVQIVAYEDPEDNDITFAEQLRRAAPDADALIVTGLDQPLRERPYFIDALNFSREAFHEIGKPILFWLTQESLAFIGNRAVDFYTQRSMMTVEFEHNPEINAPSPELERRFRDEKYRSKEDYEALKTRVNLLKKQLAEALEAEIPRRRIAQDIALPLAKTYSELDLHEEALRLLEQFKEDWDEGDARQLYERGEILDDGMKQKEAIACLYKALALLEGGTNLELSADVEVGLGDVLEELGRWDAALGHYEQNLELREKILAKNPDAEEAKNELGIAYNRFGDIFKKQGKLSKALGFFEKDNKIVEELCAANPLSEGLKNNLGSSYNSLGAIFKAQGKLNKALEFYEKNLEIRKALHVANPQSEDFKNRLGAAYNNLGGIYDNQGKRGQSLEYFEKSLQIIAELHATNPLSETLKRNLATAYGWQGGIYETQGKLGKALEFFEKDLEIQEELCAANPLSEDLKNNLATSFFRLSTINDRLGKWHKSIYWSWMGLVASLQLCRHVAWRRYKGDLFNSLLNLVFSVILPPPIPMIIFWIGDKIDLLYKRLRYGSEKPTPPPTSLS